MIFKTLYFLLPYRIKVPFFLLSFVISHDKILSGINCQEKGINRLLEEATAESRRISITIQKIVGTTSCKGVQIHGPKQWVIKNQVWITDII